MKITTDVTTGETARKCASQRSRPWLALLEDTKLYVTAPLRWDEKDWSYFAGTMLAIGVAHEFDETARHAFERSAGAPLDGKDPNSTRDALPALGLVAGTWAVGALAHDGADRHEAWSMVEAAGFSMASTAVLKFATGRKRPNETTKVDDWFQSGDSFPSMHVSAAFAIGTVLAESGGDEHRFLRRALGYGVAGVTAFARLHDNVHWFSDVVAGAALGMASARFVVKRDAARTRRSGFNVVPVEGGVMLTYWRVPAS